MQTTNSTLYSDSEKLVMLYQMYKGKLFAIAYYYLHDKYDAEDALQITFEKIMKNMHLVGEPDSVQTRALLSVMVKNNSINILNKKKKTMFIDDDSYILQMSSKDNVERQVEGDIIKQSVISAINELPSIYRDALMLKYINGFDITEIAQALDSNYHTMQKRLKRGKNILMENLRKRGIADYE
ncbi:MAG: sigma-70 family RNA polymerase sigma factor [Clostridia bacterium]|nr:sigma-70 family RNA polymerase sigma factor [Clostridia bacterium]